MATLFSWIGHIDLFAMCQSLPDEQCQQVLTEIRRNLPQYKVGPGAVKAMIDYRHYDRIFLFSNYSQETNQKFQSWLGVPVETIHRVTMITELFLECLEKIVGME